jgi:signal peptidase II
MIRASLKEHDSTTIIPGLIDFTHVLNSGAAFGFLNGVDFPFKTVVIAVIATAALIGVGVYAASLAHHQIVARLGLALIIGGAAGNLFDRLVSGSVVDFVDVYWGSHHFWAFNVADSAISVGVAIMVLDMLGVGGRGTERSARPSSH